MKRVLRDVVVSAVSCVATVGVGGAAMVAGATTDAVAQTEQPSANAAAPAAPAAQVAPAAQIAPTTAARPHAAAPQRAAAAHATGQPGVAIRRIVVEGNQRIEPSTITSYMLVHPGDAFDPEKVDLSLKTLFATGLFADVRIEQHDTDLVVTVVENPIVNRVIFEGMNSLKQEDLEKEIQAKPRSVFTPARAQADVQRIIELYRRAGRFAATVTPQVRELDQNRVDLIFEIDEGPVTGVRNISFIGNHEFSDHTLRDAIVTTESHWWHFFSKNDNYDPDRLEYDREQLRKYYANRGYADFRVVSAVAELTPDQKDFFITFTVDEGVRYKFGQISVDTQLNHVSRDALLAAIPIHEGAVFQGDKIEDAIDAMTYVAGTSGYANVDIRPVVERDPHTRRVNIRFEVNEGPRVFIERINITGNTRTLDRVIRREMRVSEGDAFNRVLLDRSKSRIKALGFFKDVKVEEAPGSQPDRSVVNVNVQEDSTGELSFAAGYSSTENALFDVSVTERNLRGRGQYLRARASTSSQRRELDLRFTEPRFLGRELAAGFDLYSLTTDYLSEAGYENQSTGFGLRASFPTSEHTSLGLTYTIKQDNLNVQNVDVTFAGLPANQVGDQCDTNPANTARPLLCDQQGTFLTSVFGYAYNWDRRNDPVNATRGFDFSVSQDFAGIGGDVHYLRTELEGGLYHGFGQGWRATFHGTAGYIWGWGDDNIRINDRFFKGGASFRGFDVAGLGPRQLVVSNPSDPVNTIVSKGDAFGGNAYAIGTIQLEFPLGLPESYGISAALFSDFGTVGIVDSGTWQPAVLSNGTRVVVDDAALRASAGLSIFWTSPFGPVQFDFAEPFLHEDYDKTQSFRFSTRTRF